MQEVVFSAEVLSEIAGKTPKLSESDARPAGFKAPPGMNNSNYASSSVKYLSKMMIGIHNFGLSCNEKLGVLDPRLQDEMLKLLKNSNGVLIESMTDEWKVADITGTKAGSFIGAHIAGAGSDPLSVFKKYTSADRLSPGSPDGWARKNKYYWMTKKT